MEDVLITTTPILENIEIQRYIGPLTANVVLGVNFFADFAASLTDIFGGNSETYQSKLDSLSDDVVKLIKLKASRMGANAIVDYKLQFNEISGKGKQMFMVSATGTACVITMPVYEVIENIGQISYHQIRHQYFITLYRKKLEAKSPLTEKDWEQINTLNISELAPELTNEYFRVKTEENDDYNFAAYRDYFSSKFEEYLNKLSRTEISEIVFRHLEYNPELVAELAIKYNLFDPKIVTNQITSGNLDTAIELMRSHKDYYTKEDLMEMKHIISLIDNLPDKGAFQTAKSGLFSKKEEEIFMCPNGHKNSKETSFCTTCGQNIKGLSAYQDNIIKKFKRITDALETILK